MRTVWKYELEITDLQEVEMPKGAEILHVEQQGPDHTTLQMWAFVEVEDGTRDYEAETRHFAITGTGNPMPEPLTPDRHVASAVTQGGALVWHIFDATGLV